MRPPHLLLTLLLSMTPMVEVIGQPSTDISIHMEVRPSFSARFNLKIEYDGQHCSVNDNSYRVKTSDLQLRNHLDELSNTVGKFFHQQQPYVAREAFCDGTTTIIKVRLNDSLKVMSFHNGDSYDIPLAIELVDAIYNIAFDFHSVGQSVFNLTDDDLYEIEQSEPLVISSALRKVSDAPVAYKLHSRVYRDEPVIEIFSSYSDSDTLHIEVGRFFDINQYDDFFRPFVEAISKRNNIKWTVCEENKDYLIANGIPKENIVRTKRKLYLNVEEIPKIKMYGSGNELMGEDIRRNSRK